ncbi:MAG TPA: hypothetical protein VM942_03070 [Acidimicrobiales bacterium]|nr:hypothetical protein [Acidimicrobiales bacterium]
MRRIRTMVAATVLVAAALGGCGGGGDDPPPTTVTTEAPTTTVTIPQGDAAGIACLNLSTRALKLFNDFRQASRGIVAPDPEPYRQEAEALRAEHASLGCPGELLEAFP